VVTLDRRANLQDDLLSKGPQGNAALESLYTSMAEEFRGVIHALPLGQHCAQFPETRSAI